MIRSLLQDIGCRVVGKAANGQQAVALVNQLTQTDDQPDVVIMDVEMPVMGGIEATREILQSCPTPVVILTAYETTELVEEVSRVGAGAYLVKPPNPKDLERAISIAIARFADLMELRRLNTELKEVLEKVKVLSGILPICMSCKKIRDDEGYWQALEIFIRNHSEAEFSHSLCPECAKKLYPDFVGQ
jgi:AmiR/NasT family two-component response regulator